MAMRTMEVGVVTFSLTRKRRVRTEKLQMSTPLPDTALKIPPRKPVPTSTAACHAPNFGILSKVRRLCSLRDNLTYFLK